MADDPSARKKPFWCSFPNMFPDAISDEVGKKIPWHTDADSPRSSQVFCISAFGTLLNRPFKDHVCQRFLACLLPHGPATEGQWTLQLEYSKPELLNEAGAGTPTQVDTLFEGVEAVVTLESKFVTDALNGLGRCSIAGDDSKKKSGSEDSVRPDNKKPTKKCRGYYGPGSDARGSSAWCVLERWDGNRSPRLYWTLGRQFFRPSVFSQRNRDQGCPLRGSNYQLMRNFLLAAAYAQWKKKASFGTIVICPKARAEKLDEQVKAFQNDILLEEFRNRVKLAYYEDYIAVLRGAGVALASDLASFLERRIEEEVTHAPVSAVVR